MTPEVSVIIPTYNRRAMLLEAIDSVLAQSVTAFELIVIDDGSTDGTAEHLTRLGKTIRIERIEHSGPAAARNRGVALARAPLIAFLDSDDLWAPTKLERQLAFMRDESRLRDFANRRNLDPQRAPRESWCAASQARRRYFHRLAPHLPHQYVRHDDAHRSVPLARRLRRDHVGR